MQSTKKRRRWWAVGVVVLLVGFGMVPPTVEASSVAPRTAAGPVDGTTATWTGMVQVVTEYTWTYSDLVVVGGGQHTVKIQTGISAMQRAIDNHWWQAVNGVCTRSATGSLADAPGGQFSLSFHSGVWNFDLSSTLLVPYFSHTFQTTGNGPACGSSTPWEQSSSILIPEAGEPGGALASGIAAVSGATDTLRGTKTVAFGPYEYYYQRHSGTSKAVWRLTTRPDQDHDGTPDDLDCGPTVPDPLGTVCGQPDRDNDNVPDSSDQCPDETGPAPSGCPPCAGLGDGGVEVMGQAPTTYHEGDAPDDFPNDHAVCRARWAPGLDDGFVPQGVAALDDDSVLVSGYFYEDGENCGVYRTWWDGRPEELLATFTEDQCSHGGGIAVLGDQVVISDTNRLVTVGLADLLDGLLVQVTQTVTLVEPVRGSFLTVDPESGLVWVGTFVGKSDDEDEWPVSKAYAYTAEQVTNGVTLGPNQDQADPDLPAAAQGAAITGGTWWISRSTSTCGLITHQGRPPQYPFIPGSEELELMPSGRLVTVSEAGTKKPGLGRSFTPLLVEFDPNLLSETDPDCGFGDAGPTACPSAPVVDPVWTPWTREVTVNIEADEWSPGWTLHWGDGVVTPLGTGPLEMSPRHTYAQNGPIYVVLAPNECEGSARSERIVVNPIDYYSPVLRFHEKEKFLVGDPNDFIANSQLKYSDGPKGCRNQIIAYGSALRRPRAALAIDPRLLGTAATAPYTATKCSYPAVNTSNVLKEELNQPGYFLDLQTPKTKYGDLNAPLYAEWLGGSLRIVYWLFYPHNEWTYRPSRVQCLGFSAWLGITNNKVAAKASAACRGGLTEVHEGDWERVIVTLNGATLEPEFVDFYQHYCEPHRKNWSEVRSTGIDGHFMVWSALGGHASFENAQGGPRRSCGPSFDFTASDDASGLAKTWAPYQAGPARDVVLEPWYGFGGAWGDRSGRSSKFGDVCRLTYSADGMGWCSGPSGPLDNYGPSGPGRPGRDPTAP